MRILLVNNDSTAAAKLTAYLTAESARVDIIGTGEEALELVRYYDFDIVVLNLRLPDMDGGTVISRMRAARWNTPVLAICGTSCTQPRVKALAAGADDVVVWSIDHTELLARMRAIVRRSRGHSQAILQLGNLALNLEQNEVIVDGADVHLTAKEFAVLQLLMLRKNMVLTKETILSHLYGGMDEPEPKIIDVFICKIRSKLAKAGAPNVIGTVWGRGYTIRDATRERYTSVAPTVSEPVQRPFPIALMLA